MYVVLSLQKPFLHKQRRVQRNHLKPHFAVKFMSVVAVCKLPTATEYHFKPMKHEVCDIMNTFLCLNQVSV